MLFLLLLILLSFRGANPQFVELELSLEAIERTNSLPINRQVLVATGLDYRHIILHVKVAVCLELGKLRIKLGLIFQRHSRLYNLLSLKLPEYTFLILTRIAQVLLVVFLHLLYRIIIYDMLVSILNPL